MTKIGPAIAGSVFCLHLACGSGSQADPPADPPADPFTCIESWPVEADAPPAAPLAVTPAVIWTQAFGEFESPPSGPTQLLTVSGVQVVVSLQDGIVAFDRATGERTWTAQPVTAEGTAWYSQSSPAADEAGNLYGVARDAFSFNAAGVRRWELPLEAIVLGGWVVRLPVVLGPDGVVFVHGGRQLHALRAGDATEVWQADAPPVFLAGAGPVLVGDSEVRSASDGKLRGHVRSSRGTRLHVGALAGFGFVGGRDDYDALEAVDPCDEVRWSLPSGSSWFVTVAGVGPAGVTYAYRQPRSAAPESLTLLAISAEGVVRAAAAIEGRIMAIGADATVYLPNPFAPAEIVALGPALEPLWRLAIEGTGPMAAVLGEGGVLYLLNLNSVGSRYQLMAVQTTSPGPARGSDARATHWLVPAI